MKIHEYQAKQLFREAGIPVPAGRMANSAELARVIRKEIGLPAMIKAQVHVGGRGKAGGIKVAENLETFEKCVGDILFMNLKGLEVENILIERAQEIETECYIGIVLDRARGRIVIMASCEGGVEIEEVARRTPELITMIPLDPERGLMKFQAKHLAGKLFDDNKAIQETEGIIHNLYNLFIEKDADLAEINPLVKTRSGSVMALDGKMTFDDNALWRHPEIEALRTSTKAEETELFAKSKGLSYIALDCGDIGCMVNGAGLAMTTMDVIKRCGGEPANFLDIGGSSNPRKVVEAFKLLTADRRVKAIFVNIFGGITRCNDVAMGMVEAISVLNVKLPIIVRLAGTNEEEGRRILADSPLIPAASLSEGAKMAVAAAKTNTDGGANGGGANVINGCGDCGCSEKGV